MLINRLEFVVDNRLKLRKRISLLDAEIVNLGKQREKLELEWSQNTDEYLEVRAKIGTALTKIGED